MRKTCWTARLVVFDVLQDVEQHDGIDAVGFERAVGQVELKERKIGNGGSQSLEGAANIVGAQEHGLRHPAAQQSQGVARGTPDIQNDGFRHGEPALQGSDGLLARGYVDVVIFVVDVLVQVGQFFAPSGRADVIAEDPFHRVSDCEASAGPEWPGPSDSRGRGKLQVDHRLTHSGTAMP